MRAIVQERYGGPEVLALREVATPEPLADQVLVKVHAASVNAGDWHRMRGQPVFTRAIAGLRKPKVPGLGWDVAGRVERVGRNVTAFRPGDEVFGQTIRTYAEYVRIAQEGVAHKPVGLTFEEAAAVPVAALTALQGLRDKGQLQAGQSVLIVGAGGGCGTFAVQIAKVMGAEVGAVTAPEKVDLVRSLGADHVIDRKREDFARGSRRYDLVLDVGGYDSLGRLRRVVTPTGRLVLVGAGDHGSLVLLARLLKASVLRRLGKNVIFFITKRSQPDLILLKDWLEAGKIRAVIDRCYPLDKVGEAVAYVQTGRTPGKVVIQIA
jgi:NADPH:quinone reductase-like Zn-dependent oxidoreductase